MIPNSQLDTWSNPGADDSAMSTHNRIRNVLLSDDSIPVQKNENFDIYLQGSYKNSTNIYADSDVDMIVRLDSAYRRNLSQLSSSQKSKYKSWSSSANYVWEDFHEDVIQTLRQHYSQSAVSVEDRALVLESSALPLTADIVVCQQYRRYKHFHSGSDQEYDEGIIFWDNSTNEKLIGYPKIHHENGADKSRSTNQRYRETIRIFKNARSYLEEKESLSEGTAPSYFVECLLYNVPSEKFDHDLQDRYCNIVNWLVETDISEFKCQNGIQNLFGSGSTQWSASEAYQFIRQMIHLWNNWAEY